ncbi:bifunctional DNA-formamidopyrimidine glycosylase/DNA-(apurinic or apyrimidinic site) lyase [Paraconexibacter antarcticus]|uniref:Formamidopyrimidine-DNA glycosylase n=1 Tax=Paraconexibacter antarcticus TaxID=2949664 RepID=A0ABY5DND5_9ACTN|nr:bifunctional DNA-formamidopyrimidine glycosylase/DNA-(apurinic or apyrimidinic site) lyase [Paraconexibacter antarcticus]UTI62587.1 bifunctional DNA-formamidopyrimidine glycosylase/DNA-(apurinic or apyrimidinic site) lyase [Paraconexibacter antarcticus]
MPELPEVETIRRGLEHLVVGRTLVALTVHDARWTMPLDPRVVEDAVAGRRIEALRRRGKYLDLVVEDDVHLLMHLRMTGTLLYDTDPAQPHRRVTFTFDDGHELAFCDPRRFGTGELLLGQPAVDAFFATRLGIEPLDGALTGPALKALARGRRAPIKAFLLDQRRVAGVGNIYADEALFRARIHPLREAGSLTGPQYDALAAAVRDALTAGLDAGGATIDDFRHPDGVYGGFQHEFLVHRREGEACGECGTVIVKFVAAGRGTYVCRRCQPVPRGRRRGRPAPV